MAGRMVGIKAPEWFGMSPGSPWLPLEMRVHSGAEGVAGASSPPR